MTKLESALDHARRGFSVFPLVPNAKTPAITNWQNLATTDPTQINTWWEQWPNANIGITTTQYLVVDIDPRNGGDVTAKGLALIEDFPKTLCSRTGGGGSHMIYRLPDHVVVRGGKDKLGPGVDIKSWGGLIVAPGSDVNGKNYAWLNNRPIAPAPEWLIARCKTPRPKGENAGKRVVEEDDTAVDLAFQWLANKSPTAVLGELKDTAYKVACRLFDFGVSRATATELLREWGNVKCEPRLEDDTIAHTIESASKYRGNAIGSAHPSAPGFEPVEIRQKTSDIIRNPQTADNRGLHYVRFAEAAGRALTHNAEPLIDGILDCGTMSIVYGESNSGKSFVEMDKDFHISAGIEWASRPVKQGATMWVAAEGGAGIYKRLAALKKHYERDDVPMFVVPCPVNLLDPKADVDPLIELIKKAGAEYGKPLVKVSLDTLSRVISGGDENSSVDMGQLVHHFDAIRSHTGVHLAVIHHTGKDKARGARGHSLLRAATDTEIEIADRTMTVTKQRDLEGDVVLRFGLKPVSIGVDQRGKMATSCYVEIRQNNSIPDEPGALTTETSDFADDLIAALWAKCDKNIKSLEGKHFSTQFALSCIPPVAKDDARYLEPKSGAMRDRLNRMLREMRDNGWLEKAKRGQWVVRHAHDAHDAQ